MKILLIGASGTIGTAVNTALSNAHQVISANFSDGDYQVDLGKPESIQALFKAVGPVDAIISTAGLANFAPLDALSDTDYNLALENKLMGQINLIRYGQAALNSGGSITLTSGILSREPMPGSAVISMANGALESFVKAAALDITEHRVNVVAPRFVKETMAMMGMDTAGGLSAADTAQAYVQAVNGSMRGETIIAGN